MGNCTGIRGTGFPQTERGRLEAAVSSLRVNVSRRKHALENAEQALTDAQKELATLIAETSDNR